MFSVMSGAEGGGTTEQAYSMEFAIAPVEDDSPVYSKAVFIKSDEQGKYEIALPPGKYWIGPKAKALDPKRYEETVRGPLVLSEKVVVVIQGSYTNIDVIQVGSAP
jgi:hypothetical protein